MLILSSSEVNQGDYWKLLHDGSYPYCIYGTRNGGEFYKKYYINPPQSIVRER